MEPTDLDQKKQKAVSLLRDAAVLGLLTFLFTYIDFHYLTKVGFKSKIYSKVPPDAINQFLFSQLLGVLFICLICSVVGILFAKRYKLAGLGSLQNLKQSLPFVFAFGIGGAVVNLLLFDGHFRKVAPGYYPAIWYWALLVPVSQAISQEIIARLGMLTIIKGVVKNFWAANLLHAVFFAALGLRAFKLADVQIGFNYLTVYAVVAAISASLIAGWLYRRYGLLTTIFAHMLYGLRIFVLALIN